MVPCVQEMCLVNQSFVGMKTCCAFSQVASLPPEKSLRDAVVPVVEEIVVGLKPIKWSDGGGAGGGYGGGGGLLSLS